MQLGCLWLNWKKETTKKPEDKDFKSLFTSFNIFN